MSATVISHRRSGGKAGQWGWAARRLGALALTLGLLAAAAWFGRGRPAPETPAPAAPEARAQAPAPMLPEADVRADLPARSRVQIAPRRRAPPLQNPVPHDDDGIEVLSEAELAAVSQARN